MVKDEEVASMAWEVGGGVLHVLGVEGVEVRRIMEVKGSMSAADRDGVDAGVSLS